LKRKTTGVAQAVFALALHPDGSTAGQLTETVIVAGSSATAATEHKNTRSQAYLSCLQGEVISDIQQTGNSGVPVSLNQSPVPFPLPQRVTGTRFVYVDCKCVPETYDAVDIQVGNARAVLDLYGTALPVAAEAAIVSNAAARLAKAVRVAGVSETRYPHPQAVNDPLRGPADLVRGTAEAGGVAPAIPWTTNAHDVGFPVIVPGGVALRGFASMDHWVNAPAHGFVRERIDADVQVTAGQGPLVGVGCVATDGSQAFEFVVDDPDTWMILQFGRNMVFDQVLLRGTTTALKATTMVNAVTVECSSLPSGKEQLVFAINGTVAAKTALAISKPYWALQLYTFGTRGPAAASFTNIAQSTW
jgi:hypothetical protein